jgi:hypothetical protein
MTGAQPFVFLERTEANRTLTERKTKRDGKELAKQVEKRENNTGESQILFSKCATCLVLAKVVYIAR